MVAEIDTLIEAITSYLRGEKTLQSIEDATTPFIVEDKEKLKDKRLSEIIYMLDMHDIEELGKEDILKLQRELIKYRDALVTEP